MFNTIFKANSAIRRHENGPLSKAREDFLKKCRKNGYSKSMLAKIAWILLSVADQIRTINGKASQSDIEEIVEKRKRFKSLPNGIQNNLSSRQLFIHFTTEWMRSLGLLEQNPPAEFAFSSQIEVYAQFLSDERGLSHVTIATRCAHLKWFFTTLQMPHASMHTITIVDIDLFIQMKRNQGWKRHSLGTLASDLQIFFRYAENKKWCAIGIAAAIEVPRLYAQENIPECPSWEDVQRLLVSTKGNHPADIRDHAVLMLLSVYAFRRGEVARLQLDSIDWANEQIRLLRPKQSCTQCYPLLPLVGDAILRYLREVRPHTTDRSLFFNLAAPIRPLSASSISAIAHCRLKRINVNISRRGAHCLRHACARHLLDSGFSLKQIGNYLGHYSPNSALSYAKVDFTGLRQVAELSLRGLL